MCHMILTTPTWLTVIETLILYAANSRTKFEISSCSRYGDITWGVKF